MRKRFTLLITVTALLLGSSGGKMWGQANYIGTPGTNINGANTNGASAVNNQFGAGESATITGTGINTSPGSTPNITFPGGSRAVATSPNTIWLGSSVTSGKNIVINSYNGLGNIQGWMYTSKGHAQNEVNNHASYTNAGAPLTPNYVNDQTATLQNGTGSAYGQGVRPATGSHTYTTSGLHGSCTASTSYSHAFSAYQHFAPYVTNINSTDDAVDLVQLNGVAVYDNSSWGNRGAVKTVTAGTLNNYVRPTTVAITGNAYFNEFKIEDIDWWYMTYEASRVPLFNSGTSTTDTHSDDCNFTGLGSYHCTSWCGPSGSTYCCGGHNEHYDGSTGAYIQHTDAYDVYWTPVLHDAGAEGAPLLDAAVRIIAGADVCITSDITDATGSTQSHGTTGTDAVLVWPINGTNFRLKVGNDLKAINMVHDATTNVGHNPYYTAAQFNALGVQKSTGNMYLYPGATTFTVVNTAASTGLFATSTSLNPANTQYVNIPLPYSQTKSGVLGVFNSYSNSNAIVHTGGSVAGIDNHGVIEIGPATTSNAASKGWNRFYIYSGGTIKNYRSACLTDACNNIMFAGANATGAGSPKFTFDGAEPLNILNDGSCCTSAIIFANAGAVGEITTNGINAASAAGDLLVRAHGYIQLDADATFTVNTSLNNNVSILSDTAYIRTKKFEYSAAGSADKGHVTLWARGLPASAPGCGGYIFIDGDLNTTSDATGSSWQNLYAALQKNSGNLANYLTCGYNEVPDAAKSGALITNVQTRIQSEHDYVTITGDFTHTGRDGGLFVQGNGNVTVNGTTTIDFEANNGLGDAVIQSKNGSVIFDQAFTYTGNVTTDLFIDGEAGVQFKNGTLIDYTLGATPTAHIGIQANAGTIAFSGAPFNFESKSTGNTQIWAGQNITNTTAAPLTFIYDKVGNNQHIDMYAGHDISLQGTLTFDHDDLSAHTGSIALRAFTNKDNLWAGASNIPGLGVCPVRCTDGAASPNRGNIDLYNTVTIDYEGDENVWMAANHDINVRHDYLHTTGATANAQTGFTRFVAGNDITTGLGNATSTSFNYTHEGLTGDFDMKAGHDIITHNKANITYTSDAQNINTTLKACNNIDIRNAFTYMDDATNMWTRWYADQDILTNYPNGTTCAPYTYGAPINFTSSENVKTHWNAGRNIHTEDSVKFHYGNTTNTVRDLTLIAQGGNIEIDRYMQIDYDSDSLILFSAEMQGPGQKFNIPLNDFATNRNTSNGNILLNDSFNIYRTNPGSVGNGWTEILAQYNIRTAMVTMDDSRSTGNSTLVESHMGDIFLGYSTDKDNCINPTQTTQLSYNKNRFLYTVSDQNTTGKLNIKAGYKDNTDNVERDNGGNIYFTHIDATMGEAGTHPTEISIPFSNEYYCSSSWSPLKLRDLINFASPSRMMYEHAGIIGGVGPCGMDDHWSYVYRPSQGSGNSMPLDTAAVDTSLIYRGNHGNLLVDAGTRGNIIINRGTYLNFQDNNGKTEFRTRDGNIDMRYPFNADSLRGSLLFLASSDLPEKTKVTNCGCDEERNNVYLQDFKYNPIVNSGSIFVGADNNIKLQYGGLKSIGTTRDPFFSPNGDNGYPCGDKHHCDADTAENQARDLILNFYKDQNGIGTDIVSGGFAAVASDKIDAYKNMIYNGGNGSGLSSVPGYGSLHGESVAGYGLYIKTQGNKNNWTMSDHDVNNTPDPWVGAACLDDPCTNDFLHNIARVTFHADARIYAENQIAFISSPVIDTYGNADYNTSLRSGSKTSIRLQADSLIYHDSLIIDGPKTTFSTWSGLYRDMPIIRLGHQRFTPPAAEDNGYCSDCYVHPKDTRNAGGTPFLDTVFVTFRNDASVGRLHTLVAEHAVISFLTDSFDHVKGNPTLNAKFYTDTFKIRNHVELFRTPDHTHDGHFELISEEQMDSKDYAGIYSRHLHMEPIAPSCSDFKFSQLWLQESQLDVITSSTFGGFGWIHASVHVENEANLFPGFASLGTDGNCYEQRAGVLKMEDLRLDKGANVKVTVGDQDAHNSFAEMYECPWTLESIELGRYADCLIVDSLSIHGTLDIDIAIRSGLYLAAGESRCFPIIQYQAVEEGVLNNIHLKKDKLTSQDHKSIDGTYYLTLDADTTCNVVYLCVSTTPNPVLRREITIPSVPGITTYPVPGQYYVNSGSGFSFKAKFGPEYSREGEQLAVRTGRIIDGVEEVIVGIKNANGEYEYFIQGIRTNIVLTFGPDYVSADDVDGASVWSHENMIYIRVDKEEIASIYLVTGQIVKQLSLSEGTHSVPTERGVYIVTLKDGSVHKVIVK